MMWVNSDKNKTNSNIGTSKLKEIKFSKKTCHQYTKKHNLFSYKLKENANELYKCSMSCTNAQ